MDDWAVKENLSLLYNLKDVPSFFYGYWNTGTSLDLGFLSEDLNIPKQDRLTLEKFSRLQQRPLLNTASKKI